MTRGAELLTVRDYLALPEGARVQLIEGAFVMEPSPTSFHQEIVRNLVLLLGGHIATHRIGKIYPSPLDVYLSEHDVLQPDVLFVSNANMGVLKADGLHGAPDLVIEILSPSTARLDVRTKRQIYSRHGVREMWVVDPVTLQIQRYDFQRDPAKPVELIDESETFSTPLFPGLSISAAEIFSH